MDLRFICTADTHGRHDELDVPDGDVFIFAGDMLDTGKKEKLKEFNSFLKELPHAEKIVVGGNHDILYELFHAPIKDTLTAATYLDNDEIRINEVRIWGSSWYAGTFENVMNRWNVIPEGIDILITHIPVHGYLDQTGKGRHLGSEQLLETVKRVKPAYHIFGHAHASHGRIKEVFDGKEVNLVNCSAFGGFRTDMNQPVVFDLTD